MRPMTRYEIVTNMRLRHPQPEGRGANTRHQKQRDLIFSTGHITTDPLKVVFRVGASDLSEGVIRIDGVGAYDVYHKESPYALIRSIGPTSWGVPTLASSVIGQYLIRNSMPPPVCRNISRTT